MTVSERERLKRAFPPTPDSFDARMRSTLANLPPRRRAVKPAVMVAAVLLALALCGFAVAASQSRLLESLFFGNAPTPEAERLVTQAGTAVERDGVTLTIDEYLLDGADLYVRWTVTNGRDEPLMLMTSDLEVDAPATPINEDNLADWMFASGVLLDGEHPSYSAMSRVNFDDSAPEAAFDVAFTVALLRPLAPVEDYDSVETFSGSPVFLSSEIDGRTVYDAVSGVEHIDGGLSMNSPLEALKDGWSLDALVDVMVEQGFAEEAVRIPVSFTVRPDAKNIVHTAIDGRKTFVFDEFTMIIDRADFTAAGVNIRYRILPRDAMDPWDSPAARMWFEVLPDGEATDNAFMQSKTSEGGHLVGEIVARASSEIPDWVRLVPYEEESGRLLPQYAVEFQLRRMN